VSGSLVVVGTGIGPAHLTAETRAELAAADDVLYLVADPLSERALLDLVPRAASLAPLYDPAARLDGYEAIAEAVVAPARAGRRVCAAFYGHPGMLVWPAREAIRRARAEGLRARMLPAVSSLDCLFADLGVDPAAGGCQLYEAGDLLRRRPALEPRAALVLWQVGTVPPAEVAAALGERYPAAHEAVLYEASPYPGVEPVVERIRLDALAASRPSERATLFVPASEPFAR
jgi:uncharacterized protein YabN with tetrapyrrole methylase and pyrophosphatase domain